MVIKYDYFFKDKPIRILQNMGSGSIGPHCNRVGKYEYAAYLCLHRACPDMWCGRLLAFPLFDFEWLDEFIDLHLLEVFHYNKYKGLCTFFIDDLRWFSNDTL